MKLVRWEDPLNQLLDIRKNFKRFLDDDFVNKGFGDGFPIVEVYEKGDKWHLDAELPGAKKEDINIQLEDGLLKISGKVEKNTEKKEDGYFYSERKYGSFERAFDVPDGLKPEEIAAEYHDGILKVTFPKAEKPKEVKKIEVK